MKQVIIFLITIFVIAFFALTKKQESSVQTELKTLRVYSYSTFVSSWGPGPLIKKMFEESCNCRVDFYDGADSAILLQRIQNEATQSGADVVLGLDQFDLEKAHQMVNWKTIQTGNTEFVPVVKNILSESKLIPFDWGVLAFIGRKSDDRLSLTSLESMLNKELKGQISMQDPKTSSPGLQYLFWLIEVMGEDEAFKYLAKFIPQAYSFSSSWTNSYGLFQQGQVRTTFSYVTSPIYHLLEEKNSDYIAFAFKEGHPVQFEYVGIPESCSECDLANQFVQFILSPSVQKIIMEKNYMFPVVEGVQAGTPFDQVPAMKHLKIKIPSVTEKERILNKWSELRRGTNL